MNASLPVLKSSLSSLLKTSMAVAVELVVVVLLVLVLVLVLEARNLSKASQMVRRTAADASVSLVRRDSSPAGPVLLRFDGPSSPMADLLSAILFPAIFRVSFGFVERATEAGRE